MQERVRGRVILFGDNINTDVIIHARHLRTIDPAELAEHAFEVLGDEYPRKLRQFDILVAGENFGCGSAREQAASCLVGAGLKAVVASSFARTFFRNAINTGLPIVECPPVRGAVQEGEEVEIDFARGTVTTPKGTFTFPGLPPSVMEILAVGGLVPYLKRKFANAGAPPPRAG